MNDIDDVKRKEDPKSIVLVTGGFDPIHSGHIQYLKSAAKFGDKLIVGVNSDEWLTRKKGKPFMPIEERMALLNELLVVDEVIDFNDDDNTACGAIEKVKEMYKDVFSNTFHKPIIFCNGGDRTKRNIPEMAIKDIHFKFSVGGNNKKNSSSWILKNSRYSSSSRLWGKFFDLFQDDYVKVKELIVKKKNGMSFQRHFKRSEVWLVSKGKCKVNFSNSDPDNVQTKILNKGDFFQVPVNSWHQITNPYSQECRIIEIQYGDETNEEDIERLHYYDIDNA